MIHKRCRRCGAEIDFLRTDYGSIIPCEPGIVGVWEDPQAHDMIVTASGRVIRGRLRGEAGRMTDVGQIAHRCG